MKIRVQHRDGRMETIELLDGSWEARTGHVLNRLTTESFDHFFTKDGYYDGWGGFVAPDTTMKQAGEILAAMEAKRERED